MLPLDDAWSAEMCELLLRGTAHALNNRIGVLDVLREDLAGGPADEGLASALGGEVETLASMSRALRALARDTAREDAIDLAELVPLAWRACRILGAISATPPVMQGRALPVRAVRWRLVRVIVSMMRAAGGAATDLHVELDGDDHTSALRVRATATTTPVEGVETSYMREVANALGGTLMLGAGFAELRLPTVREWRRRQSAGQ